MTSVQDERKTSRSQEINVYSFNEELCSSDRTGRPVETEEIQACSSEDSKSLNVELTHDRSRRPGKDTIAAQNDPEVNHEAETLNIDNETIRERIEADMDFKIPGLPHSVVEHSQSASVQQLIQKIENHPNRHALQQDLQQNQSFNPFSPESKQMIRDVGNIELCELLETEPKTQCTICASYWNIGIVYCMCGHLKTSRTYRFGKKPGDREYFSANQLKRKCKKKFFQGIHDRFIRDETFRNRMIEHDRDEDVCRQMDAVADEDHTHHLTPQEYYHYKSNWWLASK